MSEETGDQQRDKYIGKMGDKLGEQFHWLRQEAIYLWMKWIEYQHLFGVGPERVAMLNKTSGVHFHHLQEVYWTDILLHIARMTDPPKSMNHFNLTIKNLPGLITDAKLLEKIKPILADIEDRTKFCREWRVKIIAHKDLNTVINGTESEIASGSRKDVTAILTAFASLLNTIESAILDANTVYDFEGNSGVPSLLRVLERGLKGIDEDNKAFMASLTARKT